MTSNAGTDTIASLAADPETMPDSGGLLEALRPDLMKVFKPAFLGRVTVVPYFPLSEEMVKSIARLQLEDENKPPEIVERIVEGKIGKWLDEVVLMRQPYMRDNDVTIADLVTQKIAEIGENIKIRRFSGFEVGEGL